MKNIELDHRILSGKPSFNSRLKISLYMLLYVLIMALLINLIFYEKNETEKEYINLEQLIKE